MSEYAELIERLSLLGSLLRAKQLSADTVEAAWSAIRELLRERDEARELAVDLSAYVSEYFMIKHSYKERVEAYATALAGGKHE